ncbi:MAG: hypothetical protein K2K80_00100, partial [Clostridia bacterium]|nr:hypothetical protein [Clostridia bacterium]
VCNYAPVERHDMGVGAPVEGRYKRIFTTYSEYDLLEVDTKKELCDGREYKLTFDLRPYESVIFEVPYKEATEAELKKEKAVRSAIKREFKEATSDNSHVPQVPPMDGEPAKKTVKKTTVAKATVKKKTTK